MILQRISLAVLRLVLSRDRATAVLGDLAEEATRRSPGARSRPRSGVWLLLQSIRLVTAALYRALPRQLLTVIDDGRQAWRRLRARPGGAIVAAALLAMAIGLSTGSFAVLDSLVLERAPFTEPERLRTVAIARMRGGNNPELVPMMRAWRSAGPFDAVEAAGVVPAASAGPAPHYTVAQVTPGLFDMLGVRPRYGRGFTDVDARSAGAVEPAVISERIARDPGGAAASLGRVIAFNGRDYLVVGVMPAAFRFPDDNTVLWRPLSLDASPFPASAARYAYVRLPRGVPESDVMQVATRIAGEVDPRFVAQPNELGAWPIGGTIDDYAGRALPMLAGAVALIFLALCANASGLRVAHMAHRRRELGVRLALGASRFRLLRELTLEQIAVGAAGVGGGIVVAMLFTRVMPHFLREGFTLQPTLNPIDVDQRAVLVAAALGGVAVVLAGLVPAWLATRLDPSASVKSAERTLTESRSSRALTRGLLITQIAFAAMLVIGALLLARSFRTMATADRGMNATGVYKMTAFLSPATPGVLDDLDARLSALPGVEDAIVAGSAPPEGSSTVTERWHTDAVQGLEFAMYRHDVRPDFFDFYGITLRRGRWFQPGDGDDVTVIGERVAALLWPNADPIGKIMRIDAAPVQWRVVGVAKEITLPSFFDRVDLPEIYLPHTGRRSVVTASWRCVSSCPDRRAVAAVFREINPKAEALSMVSLEQRYADQLVRPRAAATLGAWFAGIGFVTCGAGLFAMLNYAVARRRREFGIRTALGATPAALRRAVSREALTIAATGIAIGGTGAWALQQTLASVLYGVTPFDPASWLGMIGVIVAMTLVASFRPARHAAAVNPALLLRE